MLGVASKPPEEYRVRILWCAILAATAAHGQQQAGQGVNIYSKEKEVALGQKLAAEIRGKLAPLANAQVTDYVSRVGAKLAGQMPNDNSYQFTVVEDDLGGVTHEPVALPGGPIFVSQRLIAAAHSEAEFAGMLAHAMAHVAERDQTRQMTREEMMQIGSLAAATSSPTPWVGGQDSAIPLGMLQFRRATERQADWLAVRAMAASGYDPAGLTSYIGRVQPETGATAKVFDPLPSRDERVKAIDREIAKLPPRVYQASGEFENVQRAVKTLTLQKEQDRPSLYRK